MIKKIGFIGLGQMGKWMASNLVKCGFDLTVFDINPAAAALLSKQGAAQTSSPDELARRVDLIILSLPNSDVVADVSFGKDGIVHGSKSGQILVDCGTAGYLWTRKFSESLQKHGLRFADAPVTGLEQRAKDATLTIMYGGEPNLLEEIRPLLEAMGNHVVHMGDVGSGQLAKMTNNILYNANIAALAEVLPMAVKLGLDPERIAEVVNAGSGQSFASKFFIPHMLEDRFDHSYSLNNAYKDMANAAEISAHYKIPLPMVHTALTTYQKALSLGLGQEDKGAMIK
ncbi:MAG: NAD(P)-dependent oxidoreductase, partial [Desulfobacterales bacterium]|nr:NAD(P)-dependent oxidoreductase [Desulfobacterales bacterium]